MTQRRIRRRKLYDRGHETKPAGLTGTASPDSRSGTPPFALVSYRFPPACRGVGGMSIIANVLLFPT